MPVLIDGREVDSNSEEWRRECFQRWRHVETLLHMGGPGSRQMRADYLDRLGKAEGPEALKRVKAEFIKAWESAQAEAREGQKGNA